MDPRTTQLLNINNLAGSYAEIYRAHAKNVNLSFIAQNHDIKHNDIKIFD